MIIDKCRDKDEFIKLYNDRPMDDGIFSFDFIFNNPHLYCLYDEKEGYLKGYANIYRDESNRLLFSGAGVRKNLPDNINAIIKRIIYIRFISVIYNNFNILLNTYQVPILKRKF